MTLDFQSIAEREYDKAQQEATYAHAGVAHNIDLLNQIGRTKEAVLNAFRQGCAVDGLLSEKELHEAYHILCESVDDLLSDQASKARQELEEMGHEPVGYGWAVLPDWNEREYVAAWRKSQKGGKA